MTIGQSTAQQADLDIQHRKGIFDRQRRGRRFGFEARGLGSSDHQLSEGLARGLGWFSIGLGVAELIAPQAVAGLAGVAGDHRRLIQALGVREIMSGVGILASGASSDWLWARVGGDAMDLTLLGAALGERKSEPGRLALNMAAVTAVTAVDAFCAKQRS